MIEHHRAEEEEVVNQASLYALGALTQKEAHEFEEHLSEGCEACRDEVRSLGSVVTALGFNSPAARPSAAVREKLQAFLKKESRAQSTEARSQSTSSSRILTVRADEGE